MSEPTDMPTEGNIDPWSWIPSSWTQGASDALSGGADVLGLTGAQPQPTLQPGLLVPPAVVDAAPLAAQPAPPAPRGPGLPPPFDDSLAGAPMTPPMLPPAEMPLPDAITGAGPALGVRQSDIGAAIRGGVGELTDNAGAALQGASDATGATSQDERDARLQQLQDATNVANMSPEARAALVAQHEQAAKLDAAAAQVKLAHEQATKIQDNFTAFQKAQTITQAKSDALLVDAQRVADTKIDPDRWRNSRSPMQTVAAYIGAIAGGVQGGLPGGGGKNIALEQMNLSIDRDIAAQRSDIENARGGIQTRQSMLAQEYARTGDMYHAQETVRLGLQEQAVREMQAQQQLYDPRGTTAIAMGSAIAGMRAQQAQALQAYQQQQFKNQLEIVTKQQENDKIEEDLRKNRAEEADKKVKNSIAYGQLAETKREHDLADQARKDALAEQATERADKRTEKQSDKEEKQGIGGIPVVVKDDRGNVTGVTFSPMVNKDGKTFIAPTEDEAKALRKQKAGIDTANQLIDTIIRGIDKYGGANKWTESPEYQAIEANKESLLFALHQAYGVEGFRPGVLEQMEKALGGGDPTSYFKSAAPGLKQARADLNKHFTSNLRAAKYTGPDYEPPDTSQFTATPDDINKAFQNITADRTPIENEQGHQVGSVRRALDYATGAGLLYNSADERAASAANSGSDKYPGFSKLAEPELDTMLLAVRKGGAEATEATKRLLDLADSKVEAVRQATIGTLRNEAPEVYQAALKTLSKDERDAALAFDKQISTMGGR